MQTIVENNQLADQLAYYQSLIRIITTFIHQQEKNLKTIAGNSARVKARHTFSALAASGGNGIGALGAAGIGVFLNQAGQHANPPGAGGGAGQFIGRIAPHALALLAAYVGFMPYEVNPVRKLIEDWYYGAARPQDYTYQTVASGPNKPYSYNLLTTHDCADCEYCNDCPDCPTCRPSEYNWN